MDHCHFLDLPFYETGKIQKNPISEADVEIVRNLLREVKPHQIFVAGDLADPHGTHRVCTDAVFAAIDLEKEERCQMVEGMPHLDVPRCMGRMGNRKYRNGCAHQPGGTACQA